MQKIANYLAGLTAPILQVKVNFQMGVKTWRNRRKTENLLKKIVLQIKTLGQRYHSENLSEETQKMVWNQTLDIYEPLVFSQREEDKRTFNSISRLMKQVGTISAAEPTVENFDTLTQKKLHEDISKKLELIKAQLAQTKDLEKQLQEFRERSRQQKKTVYPDFTTEDSVRYQALCQELKTVFQFQLKILFNIDNVYDYMTQTTLQEQDILMLGSISMEDGY